MMIRRFDEPGGYAICAHCAYDPEDSVEHAVLDDENPVEVDDTSDHEDDVGSPAATHNTNPVDDTDKVRDGIDEDNVDPDHVPNANETVEPDYDL